MLPAVIPSQSVCVKIVTSSAYSPATSQIVEKIINECFEKEFVAVVTGGRSENSALLEQKFDFVFSQEVNLLEKKFCATQQKT